MPPANRHNINFPVELTRFIGRERELAALRELVGSSRLLSLTGAGGSGKSRLALELAPHLAGLAPDGAAWVELAPVTDPTLVDDEILRVLDPGSDHGDVTPEAVIARLHDRAFLLVLDNCEHLVDACAELVDTLLRACPRLHVLVTSREALGVPGERAWLVPPLALPAAAAATGELEQYDAVRLFVDRARDVVPDFRITTDNAAAVAAICARLDGIPLAIQLAAARVRLMTPQQISERLDDAFALLTSRARTVVPRHRTLRAAMDWSYELLEPDARAVLRRLSVFRGGFSIDGAEAVCALHDIPPGDVLELLTLLLDRSLVSMREHRHGARYHLLEVTRQYAAQRLEEAAERAAAERALAGYIVRLVAQSEPHFITPRRDATVTLLTPELDNIREALHWTLTHEPAVHVRMVGQLWWLWFSTRFWTEARHWFDGALALPEGQQPDRARAALLFAFGALNALQARTEPARTALRECSALAVACGDDRLEAYAQNYLAMTYAGQGEPEGLEYGERAAAWARAHDDPYALRLALLLVGMLRCSAGDVDSGHAAMREAIAIARRGGQKRELAIALQTLAGSLMQRGQSEEAEQLLRETLDALRADSSYLFLGRAFEYLAMALAPRDPRTAARLIGAGDALRHQIGALRFQQDQLRVDELLPRLHAALGEAGYQQAHQEGREASATALLDELLAPVPVPGAVKAAPPLPPAPSSATRPDVDLQVLALGELQVRVRGVLVESWPYARPKELLVYLVSHPRGRTRVEITDALWPDVPPGQARNNFHVTLHHLRKTLGEADWVVVEREQYRISPDIEVEYDAAAFEREIQDLLDSPSPGAASLARVLDRYRGSLLAGESPAAWRQDEEDRLRRLYCEGSLRLGQLLEQAGSSREAIARYEAALAHEPLLEAAHRRLMHLWAVNGNPTRALRHFERLQQLLRDQLQLDPEEETLAVLEQIRGALVSAERPPGATAS